MWSNYDLPIEQRAPRAFLLGLRWLLLNEWRPTFSKAYIKVDLDNSELKAGDKCVAKVSVMDDKMKIEWLDPA